MTENAINEQIEALLTEQPDMERPDRTRHAGKTEIDVRKNDRLLQIVRRKFLPHAGYVDWNFEGKSLG